MFGLPGNPVSVLVGLEMYVLSALRYASGHGRYHKKVCRAKVLEPLVKKAGRRYFYRCVLTADGLRVPSTSGSGDLMSTRGTDCIAWLPAGSTGVPRGEEIPFSMMSTAGSESIWE